MFLLNSLCYLSPLWWFLLSYSSSSFPPSLLCVLWLFGHYSAVLSYPCLTISLHNQCNSHHPHTIPFTLKIPPLPLSPAPPPPTTTLATRTLAQARASRRDRRKRNQPRRLSPDTTSKTSSKRTETGGRKGKQWRWLQQMVPGRTLMTRSRRAAKQYGRTLRKSGRRVWGRERRRWCWLLDSTSHFRFFLINLIFVLVLVSIWPSSIRKCLVSVVALLGFSYCTCRRFLSQQQKEKEAAADKAS